jgi:hypothetical protein
MLGMARPTALRVIVAPIGNSRTMMRKRTAQVRHQLVGLIGRLRRKETVQSRSQRLGTWLKTSPTRVRRALSH